MHPQILTELRSLLEYARNSIRFHAERLPPLEQSLPDDIAAFLEQVPLLTRQDLRHQGPHLRGLVGDTADWHVLKTTGTTDEPAEVILDRASQAADAVALAAHIDLCLGTEDWRSRDLLHLALHEGAASRAFPAPWHAHGRMIKWNLLRMWQLSDDAFLQALSALNGGTVTTLPGVAELLARRLFVAGSNRSCRPALILLAGESVEDELRALVEKTFDCPVSSLYTLAEAGIVGTECAAEGDYHVEEWKVIVEIVDEAGRRVATGLEGDVVVTPLANRAMPLLRYRTGDRAVWLNEPCSCGRSSPRLRLTQSRRPGKLVATTGATVRVVRFAKLLTSLNVEQFTFDQVGSSEVHVSYRSRRPLSASAKSLVEATVRAALGPSTTVQLKHIVEGVLPPKSFPREKPEVTKDRTLRAEPDGPDLDELTHWLRTCLENEAEVSAAVVTGSALDRDAVTRFSDVDVAILFRRPFDESRWLETVRRLRRHVAGLSFHLQEVKGLARRAPLFTCRLLREHRLILGNLTEELLEWPSLLDVRAEGRFWVAEAGVAVWQRLSEPESFLFDPIREAWIASKYALNALRYRYLVKGERETSARAIVARAKPDFLNTTDWFADFLDALFIGREQKPPPIMDASVLYRHFAAALACLRMVAVDLKQD